MEPTLKDKLVLDPKEVAPLLGVSTKFLYEQLKVGNIPHIKLGRKIKIPRSALTKWLEGQSNGEQKCANKNQKMI